MALALFHHWFWEGATAPVPDSSGGGGGGLLRRRRRPPAELPPPGRPRLGEQLTGILRFYLVPRDEPLPYPEIEPVRLITLEALVSLLAAELPPRHRRQAFLRAFRRIVPRTSSAEVSVVLRVADHRERAHRGLQLMPSAPPAARTPIEAQSDPAQPPTVSRDTDPATPTPVRRPIAVKILTRPPAAAQAIEQLLAEVLGPPIALRSETAVSSQFPLEPHLLIAAADWFFWP